MRTHISPIAKQRISDFFIQEDGNVGRKNALMAGTVLSSVMLAATLFGPEVANAHHCEEWEAACDDKCCSHAENCCKKSEAGQFEYYCTYAECPPP